MFPGFFRPTFRLLCLFQFPEGLQNIAFRKSALFRGVAGLRLLLFESAFFVRTGKIFFAESVLFSEICFKRFSEISPESVRKTASAFSEAVVCPEPLEILSEPGSEPRSFSESDLAELGAALLFFCGFFLSVFFFHISSLRLSFSKNSADSFRLFHLPQPISFVPVCRKSLVNSETTERETDKSGTRTPRPR